MNFVMNHAPGLQNTGILIHSISKELLLHDTFMQKIKQVEDYDAMTPAIKNEDESSLLVLVF